MSFATANSRFEAYGHEVTIGTLDIEVHSLVFFLADADLVKNVLELRPKDAPRAAAAADYARQGG